ncbi:MAG: threonylcarbamoyl-AMP synthase [Candidatus Magasanikbacteria bacterium]|nr:threonylcarbamoyl-AMP synthase [Candidatus Magasanikbacteria bacterium]
MQILKLDSLDFSDVVEKLRNGFTIVYPTETCYGLGCDARNNEAVEKVAKIKQRPPSSRFGQDCGVASKPFLVVVPDAAMALRYLEWSPKLQELADKYWPGALTIVALAKDNCGLASGVVAADGTVAFRVTSHPIAARLSRELDAPLVSTSANISGQEQPYSVEAVQRYFASQPNQPDIIIDAGELPQRAPSTIVRVVDGKVEVVREGEVVVNF